MEKITICYAPDENYAGITAVSMTSVLKNAGNENIEFIILHSGLSKNSMAKLNLVKKIRNCKISYIKITGNDFKEFPLANWVTTATWFRTKIADLCPEQEKIIYLDCDTMVLCSLKELWDTNITDYYIAAVCTKNNREYLKLKDDKYFNAGVLVINCKKWRQDRVFDKIKAYVLSNKDKIRYADQDVLNAICDEKKYNLPPEYNYCENFRNPHAEIMENPKIVHFVGPNPNRFDCMHSLKYTWQEYAVLTPFYTDFINMNIYNMITMYPKLKLDELKFSILSKICYGKLRERYHQKHVMHSKLLNSLKY